MECIKENAYKQQKIQIKYLQLTLGNMYFILDLSLLLQTLVIIIILFDYNHITQKIKEHNTNLLQMKLQIKNTIKQKKKKK